jgi:hypothetical protein
MYLGFLYPIEEYRVCVLRMRFTLARVQALIRASLATSSLCHRILVTMRPQRASPTPRRTPPSAALSRYGYVTNSRVKLIIVLDDEGVRDSEMRAVRA